MEMVPAFTDVLHVPNLRWFIEFIYLIFCDRGVIFFLLLIHKLFNYCSTSNHILNVVNESGAFSKDEMAGLSRKLQGRKACIGVKKLLGLLDMAKQTDPSVRSIKLLSKLEEEGFIELAP